MSDILHESAHWIFSAIAIGPAWFSISCFIGSLWAFANWWPRL